MTMTRASAGIPAENRSTVSAMAQSTNLSQVQADRVSNRNHDFFGLASKWQDLHGGTEPFNILPAGECSLNYVGQIEQRNSFGDTDPLITSRFAHVSDKGLTPIDSNILPIMKMFPKIHGTTPFAVWDDLPTDSAFNKDQYLYGGDVQTKSSQSYEDLEQFIRVYKPSQQRAKWSDEHALMSILSSAVGAWLKVGKVRDASYTRRIDELRGYGQFEGVRINEDSERDFWSFVPSAPSENESELILMDNGNLRAVWQDSASNHVAIQFLGRQEAEYVIFSRRADSENVSRAAGIDTLEGVKRQIHAFDLTFLVYA